VSALAYDAKPLGEKLLFLDLNPLSLIFFDKAREGLIVCTPFSKRSVLRR